ncbi:unnamed protein product [Trichogramma brassicae]|uniref:Uncharacterized protein n=1 Tax=Trichogramma brassicae TaxID=86971 RepID=A0A6H5IE56_9HYME|nr:unnamed protein product [Trichogramma brassicae]
MVGNQLIIRMEKDKNKKAKLKKASWEPPCDCDVIEIKRPSGNKGPRITNAGDNNQILFRVHSRGHLNKKDDPHYRPQAVAYKVQKKKKSSVCSVECQKRRITSPPTTDQQIGRLRGRSLPQGHGLSAARRADLAGGLHRPHNRVQRERLHAAREEAERRQGQQGQEAESRGGAAHAPGGPEAGPGRPRQAREDTAEPVHEAGSLGQEEDGGLRQG